MRINVVAGRGARQDDGLAQIKTASGHLFSFAGIRGRIGREDMKDRRRMAGDWIKVEHALPTKPEVDMVAAHLNIDHDAVLGKLLRFWLWCDLQSIDGNALRVTPAFLDRLTSCPGFAAALIAAGWLTDRNGALSVPNFDRHNGHSAKRRALTSSRVKRHRNSVSVTEALPEKRREEKKREEAGERPPPVLRRSEIPSDLLAQANRLVALYLSVVTAEHPAGRSAEDAAANAMAEHPTRIMDDWERAIRGYGAHMDRNDCPKSKRQAARRFFEDRTWESYIDGTPIVAAPSLEEQIALAKEKNEKAAARVARGAS